MRISGRGKWRMFLFLRCFTMLDRIIKLVVLQVAPSIYFSEVVACSMVASATT